MAEKQLQLALPGIIIPDGYSQNMIGGTAMDRRNRTYIIIIIVAGLLTFLNILFSREKSSHVLFDPLIDVADLMQKSYVTPTDDAILIKGAIDGMLYQYDPYSEYIPADDFDKFLKQTNGSYEGIGIVIDIKDSYLTVISPFEDSPAYRAGVLPGDIIIKVNGQSTKGWSAARAVKELTGPAGTRVELTLIHENGSEETVAITRQKIHVPTVRGWRRKSSDGSWDYLLDSETAVGYIRITQFTPDTVSELDQAIQQLRQMDMKALILDLRRNPGGIMNAAVDLVDRMIDHGVIVSTKGANSPENTKFAQAEGTLPRFHLVILIDQGSASASEIVAGSLQDHRRAVIVGKRSWGKGSVQRVFQLSDRGDAVKLTTDYYYLPKGRCVHRRANAETWGVDPDIEENFNRDKYPQLQKLMQELVIKPLTESKTQPEPSSSTSPASENNKPVPQQLAQRLLNLDNQLAQALKQCKNLIRTRSGFQENTETGPEKPLTINPNPESTSPKTHP